MPIAIILPMIPGLIELALKVYQTAVAAPETTEEKRAHYAKIIESLEVANAAVQNAPLPDEGSGR